MAKRPIFIPKFSGNSLTASIPVEFTWHPGLSKTQKQKSIRSLHESAADSRGIQKILEISSKSEDPSGVSLSAFNLSCVSPAGGEASVEVLFQGSKVFSNGGPYTDIYKKTSREAKKDERLKTSGQLRRFHYMQFDWPLDPQTAFYDWLYINALRQNKDLAETIMLYDGFSDIEFNPDKSINCQAASAALYKSLIERNLLEEAMTSPANFIRIHSNQNKLSEPIQNSLF